VKFGARPGRSEKNMKKSNDSLKQALLLGFMAFSMLMIAMIWAENLSPQGQAQPAFHREAAPATLIYTQPPVTPVAAPASGPAATTVATPRLAPIPDRDTQAAPLPTLPDNLRDE
jgi:hypothetical protein